MALAAFFASVWASVWAKIAHEKVSTASSATTEFRNRLRIKTPSLSHPAYPSYQDFQNVPSEGACSLWLPRVNQVWPTVSEDDSLENPPLRAALGRVKVNGDLVSSFQ